MGDRDMTGRDRTAEHTAAWAGEPEDWTGVGVTVAGLGVSGRSAARVTVLDGRDGPAERDHAAELAAAGARVRLGAGADTPPAGTALVVTSPGWRPTAPLLVAATAAGIPVWGDVELAWRLRDDPAA